MQNASKEEPICVRRFHRCKGRIARSGPTLCSCAIKTQNKTNERQKRAMMVAECQGLVVPPHSIARRREVMVPRERTVPTQSTLYNKVLDECCQRYGVYTAHLFHRCKTGNSDSFDLKGGLVSRKNTVTTMVTAPICDIFC
jgi:hypothetical protein